jgi:hypothetical protein
VLIFIPFILTGVDRKNQMEVWKMISHPSFKFKVGDVLVPNYNAPKHPAHLNEIEITDVRPAHFHYKGRDKDGDLRTISPQIDEWYHLKGESK